VLVYHYASLLHVILLCPAFDSSRAEFRTDMSELIAAIPTIDFASSHAGARHQQ
jgi:hypothetical protein